ncbi:hypothetical protein ALC62_01146 [Cyphomyrmex costatus]|uniref:Mos1 transposase HTH domain-containing protein n=1 Tax=Cyphomyrmex costatus TaxID=456900 RepID=A0A151IPJ2_9HYME|nr:hypothetical protein ALC62_01146 [Cyphomyrmex costatus]
MDKKEYHVAIKNYFLKEKICYSDSSRVAGGHGTSTSSLPTISFWVNEFKRGRTNIDDEEIIDMVSISEERVSHILHEILEKADVVMSHFLDDLKKLVYHWTKYIDLPEGYCISAPFVLMK